MVRLRQNSAELKRARSMGKGFFSLFAIPLLLSGCFNGELTWESLPSTESDEIKEDSPFDGEYLYAVATVPDSAVAGSSFQVTIQVLDPTGQPAPDYVGVLAVNGSDSSYVGPSEVSFSVSDFGTKTVTLTLFQAGVQYLNFFEVGGSGMGVLTSLFVHPDTAHSRIAIEIQPAGTTVARGTPFHTQPSFRLRDVYGNPIEQAGTPIWLTAYTDAMCVTSWSTAFLGIGASGTNSANISTDSAGIASFADLTFSGTGQVYLRASSGGMPDSECTEGVAFASVPSVNYVPSSYEFYRSAGTQTIGAPQLIDFANVSAPNYSLIAAPGWISIHATTGDMTVDVNSTRNEETIVVRVLSGGESADTSISIKVTDPVRNLRYPQVSGQPNSSNNRYLWEISKAILSATYTPAMDGVPRGGLVYSISPTTQSSFNNLGLSINNTNGIITGTPTGGDGQMGYFDVILTDGTVTTSATVYYLLAAPLFEIKTNHSWNLNTDQKFVVLSGTCSSTLPHSAWSIALFNMTNGGATMSPASLTPALRMADDDCTNGTWSTTPFVFPEQNKLYKIQLTANHGGVTTSRTIELERSPTPFMFSLDGGAGGVPVTYDHSVSSIVLSGSCLNGTSIKIYGVMSPYTEIESISCNSGAWTSTVTLPLDLGMYTNYRIVGSNGGDVVAREISAYRCASTASNPINTSNAPTSGAGTGAWATPFQVATPEDFEYLATSPTSHYRLIRNIDLQCRNYPMITSFSGSLTGLVQGEFSITNLTSTASRAGMFQSVTASAKINNINFLQFNLDYSANSAGEAAGLLFARMDQNAQIENLQVSGRLSGSSSGGHSLPAGLVGGSIYDPAAAAILRSLTTYGSVSSNAAELGGVFGAVINNQNIEMNHLTTFAQVTSTFNPGGPGDGNVGGIIGFGSGVGTLPSTTGDGTDISKSHHLRFLGTVSALSMNTRNVGGICGHCAGGVSFGADPMMKQLKFEGTVLSAGPNVGGLLGKLSQNRNIAGGSSVGHIEGSTNVGGILGLRDAASTAQVTDSYSRAKIVATVDAANLPVLGGIVGDSGSSHVLARAVFYSGELVSTDSSNAGLILGRLNNASDSPILERVVGHDLGAVATRYVGRLSTGTIPGQGSCLITTPGSKVVTSVGAFTTGTLSSNATDAFESPWSFPGSYWNSWSGGAFPSLVY